MKTALFVGRFQPFHLGHLKVIKWILKKCDKIIIVIGSSQESNTEKNPFTFEDRKKMILNTLNSEGIEKKQYKIVEIPDVYDDKKWVDNIVKKIKFDTIFSMNPWTRRCFESFKIPVKDHPMYDDISGTKIRKMIKKKENWQELVPKEVQKIID